MKKNKKGFTLIELLVVIVIVGILAVVFLPRLIGSTSTARDSKRLAAIQRLQEALQNDLNDSLSLPGSGCVGSNTSTGGDTIWANYLPVLGGEFPTDPLPTNTWPNGVGRYNGSTLTVFFTRIVHRKLCIH